MRAVGLCAIYIATAGRHVHIGMTRDPSEIAGELEFARAKLQGVYWLGSGDNATTMIRAACAAMPGLDSGIPAEASAVAAALHDVAHKARLTLTDDATVQRRAAAVVEDVQRRVAARQASGGLRQLNLAFRTGRADAAERGEPFSSYEGYLTDYKIKMLHEIARLSSAR